MNVRNGVAAEGVPGQGLNFFAAARSAEEDVALAWFGGTGVGW